MTPSGAELARCAAVFAVADPPRAGTMAFWAQDGALPELGTPGVLRLAVPEERTVPVRRLAVAGAIPALLGAARDPGASATVAFWGAATAIALDLVARGRLLPGVTADEHDAWRVGPLDTADVDRLQALAAAMPADARALPIPDSAPPLLPDAYGLIRAYLDAVADAFVRSPAAAAAAGAPVFAAPAVQHVPELRRWAAETAAGLDAGVRISLRIEAPEEWTGGEPFRAVVQLHSLANPTLVTDAAALWATRDSALWATGDSDLGADGGHHEFGPRAPIDAMLAVRRAALAWAPLDRLLHAAVPDQVELGDDEIQELLGSASERLAAAGVAVHWPRDLVRDLTASAVVSGTDAPPSDLESFFGGDAVFAFDWQLALGGAPLTGEELDRLAEAHRPVVRLRDQWTLIDPELARKARERQLKPLTAIDALSVALAGSTEIDGERVQVAANGWLEGLRQRLADPDAESPEQQPAALAATLRDYQLRGLRWLARMTSLGLGGCLADDMGLGKTITLIALHLHRQAGGVTGPTLVVCPASLLGNWEREIHRFAPGTPVQRFHGAKRSLADVPETVSSSPPTARCA